jgi:hypothetical protein
MDAISKAYDTLDEIMKPKRMKRWNLDLIGQDRLKKVLLYVKLRFLKMQ